MKKPDGVLLKITAYSTRDGDGNENVVKRSILNPTLEDVIKAFADAGIELKS